VYQFDMLYEKDYIEMQANNMDSLRTQFSKWLKNHEDLKKNYRFKWEIIRKRIKSMGTFIITPFVRLTKVPLEIPLSEEQLAKRLRPNNTSHRTKNDMGNPFPYDKEKYFREGQAFFRIIKTGRKFNTIVADLIEQEDVADLFLISTALYFTNINIVESVEKYGQIRKRDYRNARDIIHSYGAGKVSRHLLQTRWGINNQESGDLAQSSRKDDRADTAE
jgi:hypothetical protein